MKSIIKENFKDTFRNFISKKYSKEYKPIEILAYIYKSHEKIPKLLKSDGVCSAFNPEVQKLLNETKKKFKETNKKLEEKIITVKSKIDVEDKMLRTEQLKRPSRTVTPFCATISVESCSK